MKRRSVGCRAKLVVIRVVFCVLGRALSGCAKCDDRVRREVEGWAEGTVIKLGVYGAAPALTLKKQGGRLLRAKDEAPDLSITFKSTAAAFLVCTGQVGIWQAYAQRRFMLAGDIFFAMSVVRCMDSTENYLFPGFISKKLLRRRPKRSVSPLRIYASVIFGF